ncbi:hypothetical protein BDW68DRAFT_173463 [Aspergillus falconensis]
MGSDSDTLEDQYSPSLYGPCTYPAIDYQPKQLEAPNTHIPHATLFANPDVFFRQVFSDLVGQMDGWIWELNDIKKTIKSRKPFPSTIPAGLDAGISSDQTAGSVHQISYDYDYADAHDDGLDTDRDDSSHEPIVSEDDHDLDLDRPVHSTETGLDLADLGTGSSDGENHDVNGQDDKDSLKKQYAAIEKGWTRLRQI